jgi:hypothetical protein
MPGAFASSVPGPLDPISIQLRNELDEGEAQARQDRLSAEGRGWDGIYGAGAGSNAVGLVA